jgi:hypothetical protein
LIKAKSADFDKYAEAAKKEKVHSEEFTKASDDAKAARDTFMSANAASAEITALITDTEYVKTEMPLVFTSGKMPTVKSLEDKLAAIDKKTDAPLHTAMTKLVEKAKAVSEDDRKAFDKNLSEMTNKVGAFVKAATTLDTEIKALDKTLNKTEGTDKKVLAVSKKALTPVQHRETLRKVASSLETLA